MKPQLHIHTLIGIAVLLVGCQLSTSPTSPATTPPGAPSPAISQSPAPTLPPSPEPTTATPTDAALEQPEGFILSDGGFLTPESALYDPEADLIYVSNINGGPSAVDNNGFISQVSPEGEVLNLNWIAGGVAGVTLNGPKGMAIVGNALYVADIDTVRVFDRLTGAPLAAIAIAGAQFLNDIAAGPDEVIYVSDSSNGAVYAITANETVDQIAQVPQVNGLALRDTTLLATSGRQIIVVLTGEVVAELPTSGLDGLVVLADGSLLVSSWNTSSIYHITPNGDVTAIVTQVNQPADIGFASLRQWVLIPLFSANILQAAPLP